MSISLPAQFEARPHQPDGGYSSFGSALLIGSQVAVAAVLGYLLSFVGQYFYLILVFPVVVGLALGGVGIWAIRYGKVRSPWLAGLSGFLGGCVAMCMVQFFDYQRFLGEREQLLADLPPPYLRVLAAEGAEREKLLKLVPREDRPELRKFAVEYDKLMAVRSFAGYLHHAAMEGVTIGSTHNIANPDRGFNLGYWGSIAYWVVELLIVAGISWGMCHEASRDPFCLEAREWKQPRFLGQMVAPPDQISDRIEALKSGRVEALLPVSEESGTRETLALTAFLSPLGEAAELELRLEKLSVNNKGEVQKVVVANVTYPGAALPALNAIFAEPEPPAPEESPALPVA